MRWALMDEKHSEICIIGGGMAGLACARSLKAAGRDVRVLDKGRGPGGRMAARRAEVAGAQVSFDHGAQYFTARDAGFQAAVAGWEAAGVVARWPAAGEEAWVGIPGMNAPIKAMAAELDVRWNVRASAVMRAGEGWRIEAEGAEYTANTVLMAVPAEQARDLLAEPAPLLAQVPAGVTSQPCWAVMASFAETLSGLSDCLRDAEAKISWAARNSAKPGRAGPDGSAENWVLHASPERSREILDLPKEETVKVLLADFFAQVGLEPVEPIHCVAHRWLYAQPASIKGEPARYDPQARIGIAGDYLHSPRVEGAFVSGSALAQLVLGG
ncbi:MAG: FAD-dependent oxidoreductase [Pseudomonadota bacterium]